MTNIKVLFSSAICKMVLCGVMFMTSSLVYTQECYSIIQSNSGFEELFYNPITDKLACDLQLAAELPQDSTDFPVFGVDLWPSFVYADPEIGYDAMHDFVVSYLNASSTYYMVIQREISSGSSGSIKYRVDIKWPDFAPYSNVSVLFKSAIAARAAEIINLYANSNNSFIPGSIFAEAAGINYVIEQFELINSSGLTLSEEFLLDAGFEEVDIGEAVIQNTSSSNVNINDFAGLKENNEFLSDVAQDAIEELLFSVEAIYTDNANIGNADFETASEIYDQATEPELVIWFHYFESTEGNKLFLKSKVNLSYAEAVTLVDLWFDEFIGEYYESLQGSSESSGQVRSSVTCEWTIQGWTAKECLMPHLISGSQYGFEIMPEFRAGVTCGMMDGLYGLFLFFYEQTVGELGSHIPLRFAWFKELFKTVRQENCLWEALKEKLYGDYVFFKDIADQVALFIETNTLKQILLDIKDAFLLWFDDIIGVNGSAEQGYEVGKLIFDLILNYATLGAGKLASLTKEALDKMRHLFTNGGLKNFLHAAWNDPINASRKVVCKILHDGCFVAGTPVLLAPKTLANSGKVLVLATLPLMAIPIEDVPLLGYALTNISVGTQDNSTAASDTYTGLLTQDPFVSPQQRQRDAYVINDTDWYEVAMEQVAGTSSCRLALHKDWIAEHGYASGAIVEMHLPEQGISGPFRITSIRHILPQKKPVDEDPSDDYEYQPVTGLFMHHSDDVWDITFESGETLGVTSAHPVYSTTYDDWRMAGELEAGEKVLTRTGESTITQSTKRDGAEWVYNLEVKDQHNYLVGFTGIVVHNSCGWMWNTIRTYSGSIKETCLQHIKRLHLSGNGLNKSHFGTHITSNNVEDVLEQIMQDYAQNLSNCKFIENGYQDGQHWIIIDMSPHTELLNGNGYIGKYISQSGSTVLDVKHVLVTVDDELNMINAFPTNKVLADFPND